jgi:hypothetical protein
VNKIPAFCESKPLAFCESRLPDNTLDVIINALLLPQPDALGLQIAVLGVQEDIRIYLILPNALTVVAAKWPYSVLTAWHARR